MQCPKCKYTSPTAGLLYCPACGLRTNPNCELALIMDNSVYTKIFMLNKPYPQSIMMTFDNQEALHPVLIEPNTGGALAAVRYDFKADISEGLHSVRVSDRLRAESMLEDAPVPFIQISNPSIRVGRHVLTGTGSMKISISNSRPELKNIMVLYYSINNCAPVRFGPMADGDYEIYLNEWQRFGVDFDSSDFFKTTVSFWYRIWDEMEMQPLTSAPIIFVNRFRLQSLAYHAPGLNPSVMQINDLYGQASGVNSAQPMEIFTYQNPMLQNTWQKDKRYLKIREVWKDLLDIAGEENIVWERFSASLEYDSQELDISWVRVDKLNSVDSMLIINTAKTPGIYNVDLVLSIPDVNFPDKVAAFKIPLLVHVIANWTNPLGMGLDFGTSRTMVSLFHQNNLAHLVVGLDIDSSGEEYEQKLTKSIIPRERRIYHDSNVGLIYPYICSLVDAPVKSYIKREVPGILRSDMESLVVLRETLEAIFETLNSRVMEYVLQTEHKIPRITDVCLGCPTVFSNNIIQKYREFLRDVCLSSLMITNPGFEVTVWDEVWAAFFHICPNFRFDQGHYLIWDMGGGTTDTVLVDQTVPETMPIIGFNSDFFGGKDINEMIRKIVEDLGGSELDALTEDRIDLFKINNLTDSQGTFHDLDNLDISLALMDFASAKIAEIATGLVNSMHRMGAEPYSINVLPSGGGSLLKFINREGQIVTLGEIIRAELQKLLPNVRIDLFDLHANPRGYEIDPKACTCMGLSSLANSQNHMGKINRLPGLVGRCRFTIVHRDIYGGSQIVMEIGDDVLTSDLTWKDHTNMFMVFGGSNTDEKINIPIVYATREDWDNFTTSLMNGEM